MTVISEPDNINRGQYSAVNKKDKLGFVYLNAKNFSQISLFSDHYFNHFNHCYHYYNHCYHYNDYHQFYHHYHDYHYQHYYH